jgi:hypothetical protein
MMHRFPGLPVYLGLLSLAAQQEVKKKIDLWGLAGLPADRPAGRSSGGKIAPGKIWEDQASEWKTRLFFYSRPLATIFSL